MSKVQLINLPFIEHTRGEFYWRDDGGHFFAKQNARVWAY